MRVTRQKVAENRERVVAMAAKLFAEHGFEGVGVDAIMDGVGLTHGGFYKQFRSKQHLAADALAQGLAASAEQMKKHKTLAKYVQSYLSPRHRDNPGEGCLIAALATDVARQSDEVRDELTAHLPGAIERLAKLTGGDDPADAHQKAVLALSGMVGALVLARAVNDKALSNAILAAARGGLSGGASLKTGAAP
jgi:TetR/AcrR family transcriptional repressor of nem operon